jgi:hypothetical protein
LFVFTKFAPQHTQTHIEKDYEQYLPEETASSRICHNAIIITTIRAACIPDAAHIDILLPKRRGPLYH